MLVDLWSMMLPMRLNDDSTKGPWKIDMAALTAWHRPGFLFPSFENRGPPLNNILPTWSTLDWTISRCVSRGNRWPIMPVSFLRLKAVWGNFFRSYHMCCMPRTLPEGMASAAETDQQHVLVFIDPAEASNQTLIILITVCNSKYSQGVVDVPF